MQIWFSLCADDSEFTETRKVSYSQPFKSSSSPSASSAANSPTCQEVKRWAAGKSCAQQMNGNLIIISCMYFSRGGHFCASLSELCQEAAAILIRTETDPGRVAGFTRALCTSQLKHPFERMRTRKPGQLNAEARVIHVFCLLKVFWFVDFLMLLI